MTFSDRDAWPSMVLKEARGTALVFGGDTMHSGQAVLSGERTVFVASFSSATAEGSEQTEEWARSLGGQPWWVRGLASLMAASSSG